MVTAMLAEVALATVAFGAGWRLYRALRGTRVGVALQAVGFPGLVLLPVLAGTLQLSGWSAVAVGYGVVGLMFPAGIERSWGPRGDGSFPGPLAFTGLIVAQFRAKGLPEA